MFYFVIEKLNLFFRKVLFSGLYISSIKFTFNFLSIIITIEDLVPYFGDFMKIGDSILSYSIPMPVSGKSSSFAIMVFFNIPKILSELGFLVFVVRFYIIKIQIEIIGFIIVELKS